MSAQWGGPSTGGAQSTFATRLIQAGVDVYTVQKLGRWKTISLVLRYAHHQPNSLLGGAEVLDRLRREKQSKHSGA
ncbi:MAG TPA: tyrosine-type recombinase/integrase [Nitrospiraceae bacterium]|nr:tyrosine-type recombinase/integrase [Nitrospiraceae bacterium]